MPALVNTNTLQGKPLIGVDSLGKNLGKVGPPITFAKDWIAGVDKGNKMVLVMGMQTSTVGKEIFELPAKFRRFYVQANR